MYGMNSISPHGQQLEQMAETWDQLDEARKRNWKSTEDDAREVI